MSDPQTIAALVQEGSARKPALASRLERAADILRADPPYKVNRDARLWHVPSTQRERVLYLVDRLNHTCTCPDYRQYANWRADGAHQRPARGAPGGMCKHRLAVEMICTLCGDPAPQPAPDPRAAPGLDWHRQQVTAEAAACPYLALMY